MRRYLFVLALLMSTPASAQTTSARDVLSFLMTTQGVATGDFVKDKQAADATRDTIARALLVEMATLPLATSSGAFTYRFNPDIGTMERVTQSFGPYFINRVVTAGRGQTTIGVVFRHADFTRLSGRDLRDGSLVTTANKFRGEATPFDVEALSLNLQMQTTTFSGNYGLTDEVDLSVAVPLIHVGLSGQRVNTYGGASLLQATGSATTSGLGDIAVRSKFQLWRKSAAALGGEVELRLPTGSVENLRGSGQAALKPTLIMSGGTGRVEVHGNVGFVVGGISNELGLGGAVSVAASERFTVSFETLLRHIGALHSFREVAQPHPLFAGVDTIRLLPDVGPTTETMSAAGVRWNPSGAWIVNAYLLTSLSGQGLRSRPSPTISLEYSLIH
jgi:hypothetical protein